MPHTTELFAAVIARALNSNGVPCILWGDFLMNVHGVPHILTSIDFIVPDDGLEIGIKALGLVNSLTPCPEQEVCHENSPERRTPPPAFHLHTASPGVTVGLFLQSETLWSLPPLDASLAFPTKLNLPSHYVLASDQAVLPPYELGNVWDFVSTPVVVPRSHVLLEALLRLCARDGGKNVGALLPTMIEDMWQYVEEYGFLDTEMLPEPFKTSYREFKGTSKTKRQWITELREALGIFEDCWDDCS